ncbi:MAG: class I SAM-dependent methyltransferase, partial [Thermodesulfobacteriota bacterium]|nr:class I SAM-dependent methyltransferase [Thermodesulfobacteriota bacterium]
MTHTHLYSIEDVRKTYEKIHDHRRTSEVIKNHSLNKDDIRGIALEGMDLSKITEVLDLGCGYGFFTEALKERLPANTRITGVDIIDAHNRASFLDTVSAFGYSGEFVHMDAGAFIHETPGSSFDLIIASYSLYFFAHLI